MKNLFCFIIIFFVICSNVFASEYLYILNDKCINDLYVEAIKHFDNSEIEPIKDSRGLILRLYFDDPVQEYQRLNLSSYKKIEYFLAKIENPAIIEVHTNHFPIRMPLNLKKWEISTMIANSIEAVITFPVGTISQDRINSIGYGEFLPAKNTSNNGGKNKNRVDIIILCNITGE